MTVRSTGCVIIASSDEAFRGFGTIADRRGSQRDSDVVPRGMLEAIGLGAPRPERARRERAA